MTLARDYFEDIGWRLHLDLGQAPFPPGGGGDELAHANNLSANPNTAAIFAELDEIKQANFDPDRCNVFHYNIWVHSLAPSTMNSGIAELPGDDFIVSLAALGVFGLSAQAQAGTLPRTGPQLRPEA